MPAPAPSHRFDIADLPEAEALLLEAARSAAASDSPAAAAALVLAAQGAGTAARAVAALAAAAPAGVFAHRLCPRLRAEERFLLAACALAQRGARGEALAVLCRVLPPLPAYRAMAALIGIARGFRLAGLVFACPWRRLLAGEVG